MGANRPLKIAVIAAHGRLGRAFVEEALTSGYSVCAGIRGVNNFTPHPKLEVYECDATSEEDVEKLLTGQDAVVSAIGHVKGSAADVQTVATKIIISTMEKLGVLRYVDVTGTGVRFPGDKITSIDRLLNLAVEIIDRDRVVDGRAHQEVLKSAPLNWTTIRVLKLQNVPARPFSLKLHGPTKPFVGRGEVAKAILEVIKNDSFLKQAPIIGKAD